MSNSSSVFDMIGPVMIGPSSSHTAGVVRIAQMAVRMLGAKPAKADVTFYNSFAQTYEGHGSDKAVIAGLLDLSQDDKRIKEAFELAKASGLEYTFKSVGNASTFHPNTVAIAAEVDGMSVRLVGESRGGGVVRIKEINGFSANISTTLNTLIVFAKDVKGAIGFLANVISQDDCNIATLTVSRKGKHDLACQIFEMDTALEDSTLAYISRIPWVETIKFIQKIN